MTENQIPLPLPGYVAAVAICSVTFWTNYIVCILCYVWPLKFLGSGQMNN